MGFAGDSDIRFNLAQDMADAIGFELHANVSVRVDGAYNLALRPRKAWLLSNLPLQALRSRNRNTVR